MKASTRALFAVSAILALLAAGPAQAQRGWNRGHSSKVRVPDDLGREPLEVAKTALSGGDVDRALSVYQDILDRLADKLAAVHRVPRSGTETDHILPGDRFNGLRDHVAGLIREIPDGIARYREREGPRAAADLTRAVAARDEALLRRIIMRWELTEAGPLAWAALGDILFQTGRVVEARLCADRLRALARDSDLGAEIVNHALLRAAVARAALREPDGLKEIAARLSGGDAAVTVEWAGARRPLDEVVAQLLRTVSPGTPRPVEKTLAAFTKPAWQSRLARHGDELGGDEYFRFANQPYVSPWTSYYPVVPAVSDSAVYFCDGLKVQGISLLTGSPLWPAVIAAVDDFQGYRHWNVLHEVVLDRGTVYASLEDEPDIKSDRQHMIAGFRPIETIAVRKLAAIDANTGEVRWSHASPDEEADADERAFLDRISVNTAPLVLGDKLYVGATYYFGGFRQWICAFERQTGRLAWKTYIGQGQAELNMFGNPVKEVVPGYVGETNGLLVYSTNIGVVAAVDAVTGVPKWVTAYEQEPVPSSDGQRTIGRAPGWTGCRPLFYAGRAIIAPSDSYHVYAFQLDTGEGRIVPGATRTQATQFRHVVGIHDDALILAGRKVHAFDLKPLLDGDDPRPKWEAPPDGALTGDASIDGRPGVYGDRLFLTGRGSTARGARPKPSFIACIDVRTGRMLEEAQVPGATLRGNLIMSPDAVVVAGDEITVMFDVGDVAKRIDAAIAANPDDAELRLRLGHIALQGRQFDKAADEFERARKLAAAGGPLGEPVQEAATLALYNLFLDLAPEAIASPGIPASPEDRFAKALSYATNARQQVAVLYRELLWGKENGKPAIVREIASKLLAEFPDERVRIDRDANEAAPELSKGLELKAGLLAALVGAETLAEAGQSANAIAFYQQALSRFPDEMIPGGSGTVSVWRHCYVRISEIIQSKGPGTYAAEERAAERLLAEGRKSGSLDALRTLLDRYPNSSHVEAAWIELSRKLREAGREREALGAVQRQLARYGAVTAPLLSELARALEGAGARESAREVLIALKERFAGEKVATPGGSVDVPRYVDERLASPEYRDLAAPPPLPEGTIGLKLAWTELPSASGDEVALIVPAGRRPAAADDLVLVHRDLELRALDLATGKPKWTMTARTLAEYVCPLWSDGRLLAVIDGDLAAIDPATGAVHWRATIAPARTAALHAAHGKAYVMLRNAMNPRSIQIRAFDIVTGERLRDSDFALSPRQSAIESIGGASFQSSPLWLLCRVDPSTGTNVVLDGITGEPVLTQTVGPGSSMPAMLTAGNLLVTQTASQSSGVRDVTILARNPRTQQEVWRFKLQRVNGPIWPLALTPRMGVFSVRFGGTGPGRREIVALDLEKGVTRMSIEIKVTDIPQEGVLAGDMLIAEFATHDSKRFVRAYDLESSALLWDSVTYSGGGLDLSIHPSKLYAVVRVSSRAQGAETRTDMIHFFDNRTGLLKDSITLENTVWRSDQADVDIRDRALVLRGGAEVSARR